MLFIFFDSEEQSHVGAPGLLSFLPPRDQGSIVAVWQDKSLIGGDLIEIKAEWVDSSLSEPDKYTKVFRLA